MKPIKLKLSGLNSYTEMQTVDFEKLIERGLFGIFGETGSGKSTILDAITIAMYGQIARNTKEYINSSCDKAFVSYEFEIGTGSKRKRYIVERTIKRKKDGGVQTSVAKLIEVDEDKLNVLADKTTEVSKQISEIVGLTSEDFTRSVVLPQGKFNDFLKLTGSQRRDMLERIFNLEKYGRNLIDKIRKNKSIENNRLLELNTKLGEYKDITVELHENIKLELENTKKEEKLYIEKEEEAKKKYDEYKSIYENQNQLKINLDRKKSLNEKSDEIEKKKKTIENATKADKINPYIDETLKIRKSISEYEQQLEDINKNIVSINQELIIVNERYNKALEKKNNEALKLTSEKGKIEEAIKIQLELDELNLELITLRKSYKEYSDKKENINKEKIALDEKLEFNEKNNKELNLKVDGLKISAKEKEETFRAYELEKDYKKLKLEKEENESKYENYKKELDKFKSDYVEANHKKLNIDKFIIQTTLDYENLINKKPEDNEFILQKANQITDDENKLQIAIKNNDKLEELKVKNNEMLKIKYKLESEKKSLEEKVEINQKNIENINEKINNQDILNSVNEIRKQLQDGKPCPVCGSLQHNINNKSEEETEIENLKYELELLQKEEKSLKELFENKNSEYIKLNYEEASNSNSIAEIKNEIKDIDISKFKTNIEEEKRKLESLKNNLKLWEEETEKLKKILDVKRDEKSNADSKVIELDTNIKNKKSVIDELKIKLDEINEVYPKKKEEYLTLKLRLQTEDIAQRVETINKNEKLLEEANKDIEKLNLERKDIEDSLKEVQKNIHDCDIQLTSFKDVGEAKNQIKEDKNKAIILITKGENPKLLLEKIEEELIKIIEDEKNLKLKLEEITSSSEKYKSQKSNIEGSLNQSKKQLQSQEVIVKNMLIENKFEDIYAVKKCIIDSTTMKDLTEDINSYEEELKTLNIKIEELIIKLDNKSITKEEYDAVVVEIADIKKHLSSLSEQKGAHQNTLNTIEEKLKIIKDVAKEQNKVQNKVNLLEDLDKLVQGNKFVEYVATSQLKYIAIEASKRLKNITKGRYALELDSTGNFVMRDDFNGGIRRSVDTLSGGETFLTSLALALALSSQIQLKGSAPLEFFFLDEGFGTLDNNLLETVIQSLERLHNDKLSVGIISHVDELKNRVPVKLVVKSNESLGGSKVSIEYS